MKNRDSAAEETPRLPDILPVLPLKDAVLYPYIIVPLSIGRESSIRAVDQALAESRMVLLVAQRDPEVEEPEQQDLYTIGTAASIMRMLKLPDGRIRLLVQGVARVRVEHVSRAEQFPQARVVPLAELPPQGDGESAMPLQALIRSTKESMDRIVGLGKGVSPEVLVLVANLEEPGRLADLVASNLELTIPDAQAILEELDPVERLRRVSEQMQKEIQLLTMQQEISSQARGEIDRSQREYFLRQQLRAIQQELGEENELAEEIARYRKLAEEKGLPDEAKEELERQIRRLERGHPDGAEAAVQRTFLDWLTGLPWKTASEDHLDLANARAILDEDHYDLEKIKERILEFLAVRKLKGDARGPILCFVGPPGVGKTSLGRSIARAMGRKFVRLSLGGVRDEAEIRGHRRTYVGALPGRILQGLNQAGTSNPVFMLDEIDKLGADFRGDPSSALLEVLDPEQNSTFRDHYLGVAYDLSRVLFVTTANLLDPIQPAFLDRMEVLRLSGYTLEEKLAIARRHLIPKQLLENGLSAQHLELPDTTLRRIVQEYTREAGLRNFERELAGVCRKVAVKVASLPAAPSVSTEAASGTAKTPKTPKISRTLIGPKTLEKVLGQPRFLPEDRLERDRVGVATGLAWTSAGGELMFIEVLATPGKGQLQLTGQLGDVMKESAQAAMSFARSWAAKNGRPMEFFTQNDLHIHVPAGAIPKDGPSAGITIAAAIVSAMTGRKVDRALAMTGEITLRGEVLAIGGLKEKLLAAQAAGIRAVLLPRLNRRDLAEVPESARQALSLTLVESMDEVLERALLPGRAAPAAAPKPRRPELRVARGADREAPATRAAKGAPKRPGRRARAAKG